MTPPERLHATKEKWLWKTWGRWKRCGRLVMMMPLAWVDWVRTIKRRNRFPRRVWRMAGRESAGVDRGSEAVLPWHQLKPNNLKLHSECIRKISDKMKFLKLFYVAFFDTFSSAFVLKSTHGQTSYKSCYGVCQIGSQRTGRGWAFLSAPWLMNFLLLQARACVVHQNLRDVPC